VPVFSSFLTASPELPFGSPDAERFLRGKKRRDLRIYERKPRAERHCRIFYSESIGLEPGRKLLGLRRFFFDRVR
jgi:hypothetical protein